MTLSFVEPVHTFQVDFAGVVSNIVYIQWMEIGRTKLLEAAGLPIDRLLNEEHLVPVLVHTEIDYKRPYRLGDAAHIELWVSELRNTSAQLDFRFRDAEGRMMATGRQRGLFVTYPELRPHRLTPEQRARFEPYLDGRRREATA